MVLHVIISLPFFHRLCDRHPRLMGNLLPLSLKKDEKYLLTKQFFSVESQIYCLNVVRLMYKKITAKSILMYI